MKHRTKDSEPELSIVIPAFNESGKIGRDVVEAARFLTEANIDGELFVVDDGSTDDTALAAEEAGVGIGVPVTVLSYPRNRGKGFALQAGFRETRGRYVMFADSGSTVPYANVLRGLKLLKKGKCKLAHGSRKLPDSVIRIPQPFQRRLVSGAFRWLAVSFLKVPRKLTDTQCGFKVYDGDIGRELYGECNTNGFLYEIEIILRAEKRGFKIMEFPVEWSCDFDSRMSMLGSPWGVFREMLQIKSTFG